ncbi:MAG: glycosyltransferase family 2 protein [Bacteroidia bacterium]
MIDFSIIIPVYNSGNCLQNTVDKIHDTILKLNKTYQLILIDDGSRDNSWDIIKKIKTEKLNVIGIKLSKNYGQHNALLCGLANSTGNYIVTIDDDLEQDPEDIVKLYECLTKGNFDLVYGIPTNVKRGFIRNLVTFVYKRVSRIENKSAGEGSSFRILSATLKDNLIKHKGALFFLDEIALWYTDKIDFVKIEFKKSQKNNSAYGYSSLFDLSLLVLSLSTTMPLRLVRVIGFYIAGFSVLLASYLIFRKFHSNVQMGYTSLMVAILFSTGVITASLGVIGEYVGNLIALSNNKPSYAIKEKI